MSAGELCDLTASELRSRLVDGEVSPAEIVESCLRRIEAVEDRVRAFLTPTPDVARERAAAVAGSPGPAAGAVAGGPRLP